MIWITLERPGGAMVRVNALTITHMISGAESRTRVAFGAETLTVTQSIAEIEALALDAARSGVGRENAPISRAEAEAMTGETGDDPGMMAAPAGSAPRAKGAAK